MASKMFEARYLSHFVTTFNIFSYGIYVFNDILAISGLLSHCRFSRCQCQRFGWLEHLWLLHQILRGYGRKRLQGMHIMHVNALYCPLIQYFLEVFVDLCPGARLIICIYSILYQYDPLVNFNSHPVYPILYRYCSSIRVHSENHSKLRTKLNQIARNTAL